MTQDYPERDLLKAIDPAPHRIDDLARARNLHQVMEKTRPSHRASFLWRIAPPAVVAAALIGIATLTLPTLAAPSVSAPETSTPTPVVALRIGDVTPSGTRILTTATSGTTRFLVGGNDDQIRLGVSYNGSDPDKNWEAISVRGDLPEAGIAWMTGGWYAGGISAAFGQAGTDVAEVVVHTQSGQTVTAHVANGYWAAAWRGSDFSARDELDATFSVTTTDGHVAEVPYADLVPYCDTALPQPPRTGRWRDVGAVQVPADTSCQ